MISYAQNYEDVILWRALKHVKKGCYIDIGAWDPVVDSVSMFFYTQGWRGIHAEPNPAYAKKLREARPDEAVIEAAIGESTGPTTLFVIEDTGLTTSSETFRDQHKKKGFTSKTIETPTRTLASIFNEVGEKEIHWLKIDAEGMEEEVIRSWGSSEARPWVVVVESTIPSTRIETSYGINALSERGYAFVYFDELNKYYIHKLHSELIPSFKYGPNIFDDFIRAEHKASRDQAEALDRDLTERTKELVGTRSVLEERTELLKKSREDLAEHEKVLKELTQKFEIANKEIESLSHGLNKERKAHNALRGTIENISQQLSETEKENLVAFAANPFLYFMTSARIKKLFRKINVSIKKRT